LVAEADEHFAKALGYLLIQSHPKRMAAMATAEARLLERLS
jgi:hypothetical protein